LTDTLVSLGYSKENVEKSFSSTKIWLQNVYELKQIIRAQTLELLDLKSFNNFTDNNPVTLQKNNQTRLEFNNIQPALVALNSLKDVQLSKISEAQKTIIDAYKNLYTNVTFSTSEAKITTLLNMIAKEIKLSFALSQDDVKNSLNEYYSYSVQATGNSTVLDAIFGQFGDTIADISNNRNKSLSSVAQRVLVDSAVLTFEDKFISGNNGTLIPGSEFYIDSVYNITQDGKLNTANLADVQLQLSRAYNGFSIVTQALNLLTDDPEPEDIKASTKQSFLSNPKVIFKMFSDFLVDKNGKSLPSVIGDVTASVFNLAQNNVTIKSLLFLYFISKISRTKASDVPFYSAGVSSDNITIIQKIVDLLIIEIEKELKNYNKSKQVSQDDALNSVTIESIKNLFLKNVTPILEFISSKLSEFITEIQKNNSVTVNNQTRFGGHLDTALVMSYFDAITLIVSSLSKQEFLSRDTNSQKGERFLYFQQLTTSKTTKNRVASIQQRFNKEIALTQQLIFAILGTVQNLSTACQASINLLQNSSTASSVTSIQNNISDKNLLQFFLQKQQIQFLAASVQMQLTELKTKKI